MIDIFYMKNVIQEATVMSNFLISICFWENRLEKQGINLETPWNETVQKIEFSSIYIDFQESS